MGGEFANFMGMGIGMKISSIKQKKESEKTESMSAISHARSTAVSSTGSE